MATQGKRRALGQHFLKDTAVVQQIVDRTFEEANRYECDEILEIGPGKGALTLPLIDQLRKSSTRLKSLRLVEKDRALADFWKQKQDSSLEVLEGDFLALPEELWLPNRPLVVVSNLPYSAGTAILNRLVRYKSSIPVMVLMFQAEVARRLRAVPSTPARGSLSLWIQNCWDVEKFLGVPPKAFSPPPQVDSEVVVLTRRSAPQVPGTQDPEGEALWEALLKLCFSQRRKMLRSLLHSRHPWQNALELSCVNGTKRAEALNWQEWCQLFQAVSEISRL